MNRVKSLIGMLIADINYATVTIPLVIEKILDLYQWI